MSDETRLVEQQGIHAFGFLAGKLGYLFRSVNQHDKGVDAEIEMTQSSASISPSKIIGIQVKARSRFRIISDDKISIQVTSQNLEYWKSYGRPVILVAYSPDDPNLYWVRVDNSESETIHISTNKIFNLETQSELISLLNQYHVNLGFQSFIVSSKQILSNFGSSFEEVLSPISQTLIEAEVAAQAFDFELASQKYNALATIYPQQMHFLFNYSVCLLEMNRHEEAIPIAEKLIDQAPRSHYGYVLRGQYWLNVGNTTAAEKDFYLALEDESINDDEKANIINAIGLMKYRYLEFEEAYEILLTAGYYDSENIMIHFNLALCSTAEGRYKDAVMHYRICNVIDSQFYDGLNNHGLLLRNLGLFWEALELFDRAIEVNSERIEAFFNSADLLKDLGYDARSIQRFSQCLILRPNDETIASNLGLLYCRKENRDFIRAATLFSQTSHIEMIKNGELLDLWDMGFLVSYVIRLFKDENTILITEAVEVPIPDSLAHFYMGLVPATKYRNSFTIKDPQKQIVEYLKQEFNLKNGS
jgi:tetratricopeptide (TPR) repeat protein